ncbi:MAG: dynamin family protein [Chloroflexi bacterium]|uniref:dynamin family protein n=1 Tax=Candidatus Flexifilum breve TaxID=3140694 RepID=UPI0031354704|nr:dynamin family protein [Chloroflexota bacterium]
MTPETSTKLAAEYDTLRRREHELITDLLDIVPKIDGLGEERVSQMRDALFHADHPYLIVLMGPYNAGKSSIINALLGTTDLLPVGPTPTTDRITILRYGEQASRTRSGDVDTVFYPSPLLQKVSFVDTPGLESIFREHEEITRRFLHRSDTVLLVMMATQAMTQHNLDYIRTLKEYGKQVILILNQVDLLTPEERETVRQYVTDQARTELGKNPEVWLMSSREAIDARHADGTVDEEKWAASGIKQIENYVDTQLSDVPRLRQKLQTPLNIAQNVHGAALNAVRGGQSALDQYQSIAQNVEQQLTVFRRESDKVVTQTTDEVKAKFEDASKRGAEAIHEQFQFSRALGSMFRGLAELVGLSSIARSTSGGSYTRAAFERHKVFEPIAELPIIADKLPPRLEGKDLQDTDDLVKYAKKEIDALPALIKSKVIGTVQTPTRYDRTAMQGMRNELQTLEDEARIVETEKIERALRNSLLYLAAYEIIMLVFAIFIWQANPFGTTGNGGSTELIVIIVILGLMLLGLAFLPLRGRQLANEYVKRMQVLAGKYSDILTRAANKQIDYGMNLRRDAIAPLTRLIDAQTEIHTGQLQRLQTAGEQLVKIEGDLTALGKPGLLGILR